MPNRTEMPGAGIGGLAYAGIPVTHRETNSAVTLLTGHDSDGEELIPDRAILLLERGHSDLDDLEVLGRHREQRPQERLPLEDEQKQRGADAGWKG